MKDGPDDKTPPTDVEEDQLDREFFSGKSMQDLKEQLEAGEGEPLDEDAQELDRIMKPAKGRARHPVLAGIIMILSLVLMWMMREDFVYFFRSRKPVDVGHVVTALHEGRLKDNTYIRIQGSPDLSTKATVTRRGCTLAPKSAPKSFYNFYVMRSSQDRLVVRRSMTWRQKTKAAKRPVIRAEVTGRLRRFRVIKGYFRSFKKFLWQMSARYPTLRNEHELSRAELERHVGKRRARLKDKSGQMVSVDVRTKVALYAQFKDQFEVSVSKAYKETVDGIRFQGGNGPTRCGADKKARGGHVVLEKSATAVSLDALRAKKTHRAPDWSTGTARSVLKSGPQVGRHETRIGPGDQGSRSRQGIRKEERGPDPLRTEAACGGPGRSMRSQGDGGGVEPRGAALSKRESGRNLRGRARPSVHFGGREPAPLYICDQGAPVGGRSTQEKATEGKRLHHRQPHRVVSSKMG